MGRGAGTVREFPFPIVRIACDRCERAGQYRKETLAERFGWDEVMPEVIRVLAGCRELGDYSKGCGAHFVDLRIRG